MKWWNFQDTNFVIFFIIIILVILLLTFVIITSVIVNRSFLAYEKKIEQESISTRIFAIDVKDMRAIVEGLPGLEGNAFNAVEGKPFSENIVPRNEDGIAVREFFKVLSGIQILNIHMSIPFFLDTGVFILTRNIQSP